MELIIHLSQKSLGRKELQREQGDFLLGAPYRQALDKALKIQNEKHRSGLMELKNIYRDIDNAMWSIKSERGTSHSPRLEQRLPQRAC